MAKHTQKLFLSTVHFQMNFAGKKCCQASLIKLALLDKRGSNYGMNCPTVSQLCSFSAFPPWALAALLSVKMPLPAMAIQGYYFVTEILVTFIHADAVRTFVKENLSQKTCSEFMKFSSNYMPRH